MILGKRLLKPILFINKKRVEEVVVVGELNLVGSGNPFAR